MVTRPALGMVPPADYQDLISDIVMSAAPDGLDAVQMLMCGACANEFAYKIAFMHHQVNYETLRILSVQPRNDFIKQNGAYLQDLTVSPLRHLLWYGVLIKKFQTSGNHFNFKLFK